MLTMSVLLTAILFAQVAGGDPADVPTDRFSSPAPVEFNPVEASPVPEAPPVQGVSPVQEAPQAPSRPASMPPASGGLRNSVSDTGVPASRPPLTPETSLPSVQAPSEWSVPATEVTAAPGAAAQNLHVAATMMEEILALEEPSDQKLRRVRLVEALARLGDRTQQSTAIRSYWDLAQAIAAARFAADKVRLLSEVTAPASEADQVLLAEALADAEAEEAAAQDQLLAAQFTLLRVTGLAAPDTLPWPADVPLVAPYRTQFTTIFAQQPAPLAIRQIHESLPGKLALIAKRVTAMAAAESAADTFLAGHQRGAVPLDQLLASVERLDRSRRTFVAAVVDYNHQIAEYSLNVVGTGVGSETFVATLIKTPTQASGLVDIPSGVRQAGATLPPREVTSIR
jgi:hypothetical protein